MDWWHYLLIGITLLMYAGAFLVSVWALSILYHWLMGDIIEHRKSILAARKKWEK